MLIKLSLWTSLGTKKQDEGIVKCVIIVPLNDGKSSNILEQT
jgi:hypothetical protein